MTELVAVRVRECPDGSHPEGDSVWITPTLSLQGGMIARLQLTRVQAAIAERTADVTDEAEQKRLVEEESTKLTGQWFETFVRYATVRWDLHDPDGTPWPFDPERMVSDHVLGLPVAEACNDLYSSGLLDPLASGRPRTSPSGRMAGSMSKRRTIRSRRSSSARGSAGQPSAATP